MQDRHHRDAALRAAAHRFQQVELMLQVEARGRLVEQQQAGAVRGLAAGKLHQHAREMRALLLAAGQRRDDAVMEGGEVDIRERGLGEIVDRAAVAVGGAHAHHFADGERKRHVRRLRQHRAMQRELARRIGDERAAFQFDEARVRLQLSGQRAQQRRFAGAVRADQRDGLARRDGERYAARAAPWCRRAL